LIEIKTPQFDVGLLSGPRGQGCADGPGSSIREYTGLEPAAARR
jgi:hypothetical protein